MALFEAIKEIEDALVQRLIDTEIPNVLGIVFNREIRLGQLKNPYIRVFPTPSEINDTASFTVKEDWHFNWTLMAVAASYNSKDQDQAREIALRASSAMLWDPIAEQKDRCLTINSIPYVSDIIRTVWHSEFTLEIPNDILFGAAVEVEARKVLTEV